MSHTTGLQKAAAAGVAGITVATFATSFHALTGLAVETGATGGWLAPMLPVALDGMVVAASMAVVAARRAGRPAGYSWFLVGLYTSLSVAGNAAHAAARGPLAAFIAAAFPLTLFLSFEQLLRITTAPDRATGRERGAEETRAASGPREDRQPAASWQFTGGASASLPVLTDWSSGPGSALEPGSGAAGDAEARAGAAGAGDARARVRTVWEAHRAGGGDPTELTGLIVAEAAGCSVRRAQELLAELRADQPPASVAGNGHAGTVAGGVR
jgi:Protein of unknown function (DUF2637)